MWLKQQVRHLSQAYVAMCSQAKDPLSSDPMSDQIPIEHKRMRVKDQLRRFAQAKK